MLKLNVEKVNDLIEKDFGGNKRKFANEIGVSRSYISMITNYDTPAGKKVIDGVISYCQKNGLDYRKYIFLPPASNQ